MDAPELLTESVSEDKEFVERLERDAELLAQSTQLRPLEATKKLFIGAYSDPNVQDEKLRKENEAVALLAFDNFTATRLLEPVVADYLPVVEQQLAQTPKVA